jgi:hypothetical protein
MQVKMETNLSYELNYLQSGQFGALRPHERLLIKVLEVRYHSL